MTDEERRRVVAEIRERAAEAAAGHSMSDEESELALLGMQLDDDLAALERLADGDPVGAVWFGDDDRWIDKRLNRRK